MNKLTIREHFIAKMGAPIYEEQVPEKNTSIAIFKESKGFRIAIYGENLGIMDPQYIDSLDLAKQQLAYHKAMIQSPGFKSMEDLKSQIDRYEYP